jgi:cytochrome c
MKKIILTAVLSVVLISCGEKKTEKADESETSVDTSFTGTTEVNEDAEIAAEFKKGKELIDASDCLGCHKIDEKLVGPSYKEVAAKYSTKDEAMLAKKIVEGGTGNWGEIPMTAHAGISIEDATEMVKYILSLK